MFVNRYLPYNKQIGHYVIPWSFLNNIDFRLEMYTMFL